MDSTSLIMGEIKISLKSYLKHEVTELITAKRHDNNLDHIRKSEDEYDKYAAITGPIGGHNRIRPILKPDKSRLSISGPYETRSTG